jgi:CheY-like chemotaxis protein
VLLIVDDNSEACGPIVRLFRHAGHDTRWVGSGPAALDFLTRSKPEAILLDIMMPEMDGLEVLRRIRSDPRFAGIPVIIYSGGYGHEEEAMKLGADDFVTKAKSDWDDLYQRVKPHLH